MLESVANSKTALRSYVEGPGAKFPPRRNGTPNSTKEYVQDHEFWTELDELITILRLDHESQKMSEANDATMAQWLEIQLQLTAQSRTTVFMSKLPLFDGEISSSTQQTNQLGSSRCSLSPPNKSS